MLIQGAGGIDDDEDDEDTDGSQDGNTGKRAKITPECRQHGGMMVEVERKETIPTTRKVEIVKKSKIRSRNQVATNTHRLGLGDKKT
jgi:hypothetical protein